jgi:GNAT superfamily N-acetyltransferase/CelD/BcsL family acetyltransferase involved in cellulose biosynthesis
MGLRCDVLHDGAELDRLAAEWDALSTETGAGLFLSHRWIAAWWRAFRGVDELWLAAVRERDGERLRAVWPLVLRAPRSGPLKLGELRLLGDLGGTQRSLLAPETAELEAIVDAVVDTLVSEAGGWDLLEVPMRGRATELVAKAVARHGRKAVVTDVIGRPALELPPAEAWDDFVRARRSGRTMARAEFVVESDPRRGLEELMRLCRKEWASHKEPNPAADPQAMAFLDSVVPPLARDGRARIGLLRVDGVPVAGDLVVRSRESCVELLLGVDPEHAAAGALAELAVGTARQAVVEGARRFAFALGAAADENARPGAPSPTLLGAVALRGERLRVWNGTALGRLHRGVVSIRDALRAPGVAGPSAAAPASGPEAAAAAMATRGGSGAAVRTDGTVEIGRWDRLRERVRDGLRERAPEVVQRAVARVASYVTLHLYRGELFTRDVIESPDLSLRLFSRADFEALDPADRELLVARLEIVPAYCRQKWDRGDMVVLATVAGRPAGIVWCARTPVYVPDIAREVRPQSGECYIHDVFVHPAERGRQVAPAMLDFLARELRARDVYRAWALIERSNTASTRAFEKAAYAAVADVIYAKMGLASRISVRPPDPEAKTLLGL